MSRIATFSDIIDRYGINYVPGDIRFTGNSAKIGSDRDDALRVLVEGWRHVEPQLGDLFHEMLLSNKLLHDLDEGVAKVSMQMWTEESSGDHFRAVLDERQAMEVIRDAQSGALIITLSDLLGRFRRDVNPTRQAWQSASPLIANRSLGVIIDAGANSFRHYNEWQHDWNERQRFSRRQLNSIEVIADVLHVHPSEKLRAACNASFGLLWALSRGDWEILAHRLFKYAQAVADS